jgi:hypothetical protein
MKHLTFSSPIVITSIFVSVLTACGGGAVVSPESWNRVYTADYSTKVANVLSSLTTAAGLKDSSVLELFSAKYKDDGYTKAQLTANLAAIGDSLMTDPDLSLFPMGTLSNVTISGCNAEGICDLSATLTNSDADITQVSFTTKVISIPNGYAFYGDQIGS